jgi:outer membrane lipoprotein
MYRYRHISLSALAALLVAGCASQVPLPIREGPADSPAPTAVRGQVGDYAGQAVRWGGVLIATENRADTTRLTILARPLASDGEPGSGDASLGRFIAIVPEFLDPKVYAPERLVTVTGTLRGSESGRVGEHPYTYPVLEARAWYLWPRPSVSPYYYDDPWFYDPWWYDRWHDPWYYGGYPYAYPYGFWR